MPSVTFDGAGPGRQPPLRARERSTRDRPGASLLLGLDLAGTIDLPEGIAGAHPAMMVVGYLILAGVALDEQLLGGRAPRGSPAPA